jgi:plastocyanin
MANTVISLLSSGESGNAPLASALADGELALNFADGIIYYKTAIGSLGQFRLVEPSGLDGEVQFNDAGSFGSNSTFTFDKSNNTLTLTGGVVSGGINLTPTLAAAFNQANSVYLPSVTRLDVTNSGASSYLFDQYTGNNPELYIRAGETLAFSLNVIGHPFLIRVSSGGTQYSNGLTHVSNTGTVLTGSNAQAQVDGTLYWKVPAELAGNTYVYQCQIHGGMVGNIVIERPNQVASVDVRVNAAFDKANSANILAQAAFDFANTITGGSNADAAFDQANGAFDKANSATILAQAAFDTANAGGNTSTSTVRANSEFFIANGAVASFTLSSTDLIGKVNNSIVTVDGLTQIPGLQYSASANSIVFSALPVANSLIEIRLFEVVDANSVIEIREIVEFVPGNSFFTLVYDEANNALDAANDASVIAQSAFNSSNTNANTITIAFTQANNAFDKANSANILAQAAFDFANTISGGSAIDNLARELANSASILAQASFDQANLDFTTISTANGVFGNSTHVPVVSLESNGRVSSISTIEIVGGGGGGGGGTITFDTDPPESGNSVGDIWIDSNSGIKYHFFDDGDSLQWVEFGPISPESNNVYTKDETDNLFSTITYTKSETDNLLSTKQNTSPVLTSYQNDGVSFRNRIINGDMRIDQRNNGAAVTVNDGAPYVLDRFFGQDATGGAFTMQRSSVAPAGFTNSLLITVTTADTSLGATELARVTQRIEGSNVTDLGWGTADAQTITLSFWVRSSLTGVFGGSLTNSAFNRSYPFTYTISAASTWEYKTIAIPGDTTGTWLTNNGSGIELNFGLGVGSTFSGTAGSWSASGLLSATGAVSVIGTLDATWQITGVQLEAGSVATPFERRPFGLEDTLCKRYFQIINAFVSSTGGFPYSTGVTKRAAPTITSSGPNGDVSGVVPSTDHFWYRDLSASGQYNIFISAEL